MKIFTKKVLKILPIWLLAVILVSTATAAFIWISNMRVTWIDVREYPITLTGGDFVDATYQYETTYQSFDFVVNDATNSTGYVWLEFTTSSSLDTLDPGDIDVDLYIDWGSDGEQGYHVSGYPTSPSATQLRFLFGDYIGDPLDFDLWGSTGMIYVTITYNVAYSNIHAGIRITSSLDTT